MGPLQLAQDIGSKWIYWPWVGDHLDEIRTRLAEHITLTFWAVLLGFLIAFPLALLAVRYRRLYPPVIGVTGVLYTIPSIALFVFLIPWTGLSRTTALVPLVAYTLLILIRNIVAGLDGVPPEVREAAQGMGYRRLRQLFSVELPLALPAIVAGIRIATVTTIGLITVTALIGQGGLGQFMIDGFQRDFRTPLTVGIVLSVALAVAAADVALTLTAIRYPRSAGVSTYVGPIEIAEQPAVTVAAPGGQRSHTERIVAAAGSQAPGCAVSVELTPTYEESAAELLREAGLVDRVERRVADFVDAAAEIQAADIVVMNRVICCYPNLPRLAGAAADHARRILVMSFPKDRWWTQVIVWMANVGMALTRRQFRIFVHPTAQILGTGEQHGLNLSANRSGIIWQVAAMRRAE